MSERNRENVKRHLDACPDCAKEFKALEKILLSADSLGLEMKSMLAGIDWDAQAEMTVAAVWEEKRRPQREPKQLRLWR